jgi:small-conductance mechanosensitive channel
MDIFDTFFNSLSVYSRSWRDNLSVLLLSSLLFIGFILLKELVFHRLFNITLKTKNKTDDLIITLLRALNWPFYLFLSVYITSRQIAFQDSASQLLSIITWLILAFYSINVLRNFLVYLFQKATNRELSETQKTLFRGVIQFCLWSLVIITVLQNIGIKIEGLIAGLGIGGIAIAFALQSILTELFASLSLYLDRPFEIGDFVIVGKEDMGTVEHIGLKSTRLRSLQGEELIVSNKELTEVRIQNFKRMTNRQVKFRLNLEFGLSAKVIKTIPELIKKIIEHEEMVDFESAHLISIDNSALMYEIVYNISSPDFGTYRRIHQNVLLSMIADFEKQKIHVAYPTQTIKLEQSK